ncbi:hypothetical protein L9F63_012491 [Diploptera punctata]|uniref:Uncharacterized protein n=1 Tax=Diploptera punctata TaxID=6984 RepID=A0AAD8AEN0_DIPPU|nr:hypothetical protein L9F63_012491 [Diploptera punctata]
MMPFISIKFIAAGVIAVPISKIITNIIWNFLPKRFISELEEKAVLITGCDSGFGNELAWKLDGRGMTVYAGCLYPSGQGALRLINNCSNRLVILHLDISKDQLVQDAVNTVNHTLGNKKLWAVVNNAGVPESGELEWIKSSACQEMINVNTIGAYRVTQTFLPLLRRSAGRVVIVTSVLGQVSTPGAGPYCMSKHALTSFADSLRREMLKWNVTVHTVEPWMYDTSISEEKRLFEIVEKNWTTSPQIVHEDYGEEYVKEFKNSLQKILKYSRPQSKIYEVVDEMEHATIGTNPKIRYVPGLVGQFWIGLLNTVPTELLDLVTYMTSPKNIKFQQES